MRSIAAHFPYFISSDLISNMKTQSFFAIPVLAGFFASGALAQTPGPMQWRMAPGPLKTRWADQVNPQNLKSVVPASNEQADLRAYTRYRQIERCGFSHRTEQVARTLKKRAARTHSRGPFCARYFGWICQTLGTNLHLGTLRLQRVLWSKQLAFC